MKKWLRRIRGAVRWDGIDLGSSLGRRRHDHDAGVLLVTGSRPDAPFPLMFGAFGFVAGNRKIDCRLQRSLGSVGDKA
jgi:hypothetical protein